MHYTSILTWSPCICVMKILVIRLGRTEDFCSWTCDPSPQSNIHTLPSVEYNRFTFINSFYIMNSFMCYKKKQPLPKIKLQNNGKATSTKPHKEERLLTLSKLLPTYFHCVYIHWLFTHTYPSHFLYNKIIYVCVCFCVYARVCACVWSQKHLLYTFLTQIPEHGGMTFQLIALAQIMNLYQTSSSEWLWLHWD